MPKSSQGTLQVTVPNNYMFHYIYIHCPRQSLNFKLIIKKMQTNRLNTQSHIYCVYLHCMNINSSIFIKNLDNLPPNIPKIKKQNVLIELHKK